MCMLLRRKCLIKNILRNIVARNRTKWDGFTKIYQQTSYISLECVTVMEFTMFRVIFLKLTRLHCDFGGQVFVFLPPLIYYIFWSNLFFLNEEKCNRKERTIFYLLSIIITSYLFFCNFFVSAAVDFRCYHKWRYYTRCSSGIMATLW